MRCSTASSPAAASVQASAWPGQACVPWPKPSMRRRARTRLKRSGSGFSAGSRLAAASTSSTASPAASGVPAMVTGSATKRRVLCTEGSCRAVSSTIACSPPWVCAACCNDGSRITAIRLLPSRPAVASQVCESRPTRFASSARESGALAWLSASTAASSVPSRGAAPAASASKRVMSSPAAAPAPCSCSSVDSGDRQATKSRIHRSTCGSASSAKPSRCATVRTGMENSASDTGCTGTSRATRKAAVRTAPRSSPASVRCSAGRWAWCAVPSFMRTRWPNTSPAALPAMARGTGSAAGRTRSAPCASSSDSITSARLATHRRSASFHASGGPARSSA